MAWRQVVVACVRAGPAANSRPPTSRTESGPRRRWRPRVRSAGSDNSRMSVPSMRIGAFGDVVEPGQQRDEGRLARAGGADQRQRLPRFDGELDVAQRPIAGRSAELSAPHAGNRKPTSINSRRPPAARRPVAVGDLTGRVEDLGDPVGGGHRLLGHRQQEAQRGDGPYQRQHHRDEGDQRSEGDQSVSGRIGAEPEHDDQRQVGDHLQQCPELRRHRDFLDLRVVEHGGLLVEPFVDVVLAAERLDRAQTQRRLLDVGGDMAGLVLCQPGQPGERRSKCSIDQA